MLRLIAALFVLVAMFGTAPVATAGAADVAPFDEVRFEVAQRDGKPILIQITAPWCPACKAQAPILAHLRLDPRFKDLQTFNIDFDSQKDLMRRFHATLQSTLICFKGRDEVARSTGETQPEWIEGDVEKTIR
jgi:thioredoxin 1